MPIADQLAAIRAKAEAALNPAVEQPEPDGRRSRETRERQKQAQRFLARQGTKRAEP